MTDTVVILPRRILLVEDDPIARRISQAALSTIVNCNVDAADSAESAIVFYQQNVYDLIVLDIQLPGLDGNDFYNMIRDHVINSPDEGAVGKPFPRMIVMTGHFTTSISPDLLFGQRISAILRKPLMPQTLVDYAERALKEDGNAKVQ